MQLNEILVLVQEGKFDAAENAVLQLSRAKGNPALIFAEWARMEIRRSNTAKALELIDKSLELAPENADFIFEKGVILFHAGKKSLALLQMDRALELEPKNPFRHSGRAFIKDSLGDLEGAIADYEAAILLDPEDAVSHNNLGLLQEKLGWKEKAGKNFIKADKLAENEKLFSFLDNAPDTAEDSSAKPEPDNEDKKESRFSIMKQVFTNAKMRNEFWHFIRSGLGGKKKNN